MDEKHKEIIKEFYENAQMILPERKELPLIFFIISREGVLPLITPNVQSKDMISQIVQQVLLKTQPEAVFCVTEAWVVIKKITDNTFPKNNDEALDGYAAPSEHPDRKEFLSLYYLDGEGKFPAIIQGEIKRDIKGTPYVPDYELIEDVDVKSIFFSPWKGNVPEINNPIGSA